MEKNTKQKRGAWSSKMGFILAGSGSAIGLGNIWRFPYITGQNGGAAFVLIYLICITFVGFPVMIAALALGRRTQKNAVGAFSFLTDNSLWKYAGYLMVATGLIVFSWYSVIAGWIVGYLQKTIIGVFNNVQNPEEIGAVFSQFVQSPWSVIWLTFLFIGTTGLVVLQGIKGGIERTSRLLMPALFVILVLLAIRSLTLPGASEGLLFFVKPDFSKISVNVLLAAMGQAFLSLSLGGGTIITFGSYLSRNDNIPSAAAWVCIFDTIIAILAGFVILPAVAAMGQEYSAGPGLIFQALPSIFGKMPGGQLFGIGLFFMLIIAALTSSISMLEISVAYVIDEKNWSRRKGVFLLCGIAFIMSIPAALASGASDFWTHLPVIRTDFFTFISTVFGEITMSLGGLFIALFVGWWWTAEKAQKEIEKGNPRFFYGKTWIFIIKYCAPVAITIVFIYTVWSTYNA